MDFTDDDDDERRYKRISANWATCISCCIIGSLITGIVLAVILALWLRTPISSTSVISTRPSLNPHQTSITSNTTVSSTHFITTTTAFVNTTVSHVLTSTTSVTSTTSSTSITSSTASTSTTRTTSTSVTTTISTSATTFFNSCTGLRWNQTGIRVAGSGTEGSGSNQFKEPRCVYVDANGTLYICDTGNDRIQRWPQGASVGTTVAGGVSGTGLNQLKRPQSLTFDKHGSMYVADSENHRVLRYSLTSTMGTLVAGQNTMGGSGSNQLTRPSSILVDDNLNLYIADMDNNRVMRYAANASIGTLVISGSIDKPYSIAFRTSIPNQLFISAIGMRQLELWAQNTSTRTVLIGTSSIHFDEPSTVITDPFDNVYVADYRNAKVQMFCNGTWVSKTVVGPSLGATPFLSETHGIAFDADLNLYVTSKSPTGVYKYMRI